MTNEIKVNGLTLKKDVPFNVLSLDGGNCNVKIFGNKGAMKFTSLIGEYRERKLESKFSEFDVEFEYKGRKGFAGTLAEYESQFASSRKGDTKAHDEFLLRTLIGTSLYSGSGDYKLLVAQPISRSTKAEKIKMKQLLEKSHDIIINGQKNTINILEVNMVSEGAVAFWSKPVAGTVRVIDLGSGTVNCATIKDGRYIDKESFTMKAGRNTMLTDDIYGMASAICNRTLETWNPHDLVYVVGGCAEEFHPFITHEFFNAEVVYPEITVGEDTIQLDPIFANVVGMSEVAKKVY